MGVSLAALERDTQQITVEVGGSTLNLTVRPSALTPTTLSALEGVTTDLDSVRAIVSISADLISAWDLTETDDGPVLPVTVEVLNRLPVQLLFTIITAVGEGLTPGKASSES